MAVPGGSIAVLASDTLDLEAAARKLEQRRAWLDTEIARAAQRLENSGFVGKAPAAVVQAERDKLAGLREERGAL